jgi:hypothetical protein
MELLIENPFASDLLARINGLFWVVRNCVDTANPLAVAAWLDSFLVSGYSAQGSYADRLICVLVHQDCHKYSRRRSEHEEASPTAKYKVLCNQCFNCGIYPPGHLRATDSLWDLVGIVSVLGLQLLD